MNWLSNLLSPLHNCEETVCILCEALKVPITQTTLTNALLEHPDYPSLLSVSDVLQNYGVDNVSLLMKEKEKIVDLQTPFLACIMGPQAHIRLFSTIYRTTTDEVEWWHPEKHIKETISFEQFSRYFTGYVQIYEIEETSGEKDYITNLKQEKRTNLINHLLASLIPALGLLVCVISIFLKSWEILFPVFYCIALLVGVITSTLLILYEIDQFNPTLQKVCAGGKKTNCAAILHSKGASIWGIHWSVIGFSYFMGMLIPLLSGGILSLESLNVAAWINVFVLPYTIYSVYYQFYVIKQWCPLCLTVQAVLVLLFIISLSGGLLSFEHLNILFILPYIVGVSISFLAIWLLFSALKKVKASRYYLLNLQRTKHNPLIFDALLAKQKKLNPSPGNLGIILGNPNGRYHLIKVCNPYCEACVSSHPIIDNLILINPEIKLQIIFYTNLDETDIRIHPIRHLLSIYESVRDNAEMIKALDDWYLPKIQDYNQFARKYPTNEKVLLSQDIKVREMRAWCDAIEIGFTPTFFINGYQLPDMYSVADLRYFLSV